MQEEAIDRATRLPKITIHNETEVIESVPTANEMGGVTHPWTTVAIDCARMQSYLPKGESMPGTAFIEEYFPHTQISAKKTRICQHVAASAQQLHWDFKPRGSCDTKELLGSYCGRQGSSSIPCHTDKMVNSDGANSKRKHRDRRHRLLLVGNCYQSL